MGAGREQNKHIARASTFNDIDRKSLSFFRCRMGES